MRCKTLYENGRIYTMDEEMPYAEWVAVDEGRIAAIGCGKAPQTIEACRVIDLEGMTMLPGLFDSHMHGTPTGASLSDVDLTNAANIKDVLDLIEEAAAGKNDDSWITCSCLDSSKHAEKRAPLCTEIDRVSGKHPVYIKNMTLHGCTINTKAMDLIKVPDNLKGIVTDDNGERTGEFSSDDSANYIANTINDMTPDSQVRKYIRDCADWCASKGCTTISGLDGGLFDKTDRDFYMWMNMEKDLPIHVEHFFQTLNVEHARALGLPRVGGCICLDGAGFEGTMATREPYNDGPFPTGVLYYTDDEIYNFMWNANKHGMQFGIHALGDRAIDQYLRCYERVYKELGLEGNPLHNRIEHFTMVHPEHIEKAVKMGLILSMQPRFTYKWDNPATEEGHAYESMMPKASVDWIEPYTKILEAGGIIAGGSDSPVTPVDPVFGIYALCNMPNETKRVSVTDAIKAFTINGAIANFKEDEKGSITIGKNADFTVLDRDPYEEPEAICDFKVMKTIVCDRLVYSGKEK